MLISQIPQLQLAIECASQEYIFGARVYFHLRDVAIMAFECLRLLYLGLAKIVKSDEAVFMARENKLVIACEVTVQSRGDFVVRENRRLNLLSLHIINSDLMVSAASH